MNIQGSRTQIQVIPNSMFLCGNSLMNYLKKQNKESHKPWNISNIVATAGVFLNYSEV